MTDATRNALTTAATAPLLALHTIGLQSYFLEVTGPAHGQALSVESFEATERLGEPYRIVIELTHPEALAREEYLGRDARFTIAPPEVDGLTDESATSAPRIFSGCITSFSQIKTTRDFSAYRMVVEAHITRLNLTHSSRIYQQQSAPQIIEAILRRHGFKGHQFSFTLRRAYPTHAFRFQYQLADWPYIHLLMQQEGIYSTIVAGEFGDVVTFADDIDHYLYKPTLTVPYREVAGLQTGEASVFALQTHAHIVPASFAVADYNPDQAYERLRAEANVASKDVTTYGQPYVYGTHHLDAAGAAWEAQLRHEAAIAWQVQYVGESSVLELCPARILRMDTTLPDAPNGQLIVSVTHRGARDASYRNHYTAIPSDRRFRLKLDEAHWPTIPGTLSGRITSPGQYTYAYLTAQGYYTVRFDCDFDTWNPGGESVPLRLAKPFAGSRQTGFHFPALDGAEAVIAFRDGDPNKPYIAQFHHHSQAVDLVTNQDRWLSRNMLRTQSNNKLRMEDWKGEEHIKLSTEHSGKSQLSLGHLVDSKKQPRGEGFELRTDAQGALRAGGGLLLSADKQERASGQQIDMAAALDQMAMTLALTEALADGARIAKAEIADLKAENQWLKDSVEHLKQAVMVLSAPHGIVAATPDRVSVAAGKDVNISTRAGLNLSAMKNIVVGAADTLSLFAHTLGIKLFAARGKVQIQAQSDAMELIAAKNMQLTSASGTLTANAAQGVVLSGGGSAYIKVLGDNVEIGGAGHLILKIIEVQKSGPGALTLPLPTFQQIDSHHDEKFILSDQLTGRPLAQRPYRIQLDNGHIVDGETNEKGETSLTKNDVAQGLTLTLPKRKEA